MTIADLVTRQAAAREALLARVEAVARRTWVGLGSWSGDDVERFLRIVLPIIEAGQVQTAAVTEAYLAQVLSDLLDEDVAPLGRSGDARDLRPVGLEEVYRRPFVTAWTALKAGQDITEAVRIGADRLGRLVEDDLSLAHRRASLTVLSSTDNVTGFRRVIRPELARSGSCALCTTASTNRYRTDRLMPIHTRCHCEVMPIIGARDPGETMNSEDRQVRKVAPLNVTTYEHGELGPVLRNGDHEVTGPKDIAA